MKQMIFLLGLILMFSSCTISDSVEEDIIKQVLLSVEEEYNSLPEITKFKIDEISSYTNFKLKGGIIIFNNAAVVTPKSVDFYGKENTLFYQDEKEGNVLVYKNNVNYINRTFSFGSFIGLKITKNNIILFKFIKSNNEFCYVSYKFNDEGKPTKIETYNWP